MTATSRAGQYEQVRREHMAEDNQLRDINGLTLAAVATAAGCSRLFARSTLRQWGLIPMVDDSELVISGSWSLTPSKRPALLTRNHAGMN